MERIIKTERLILKQIEEKDFSSLSSLLTDKDVGKSFMLPEFESGELLLAFIKKLAHLSLSDERFLRGIFLGETFIGMINDVEIKEKTVEVGYALLPFAWGKGYACEALSSSIDYLFSLGFECVKAGAFDCNKASIRVMQKCGMSLTDECDSIEYRGKIHNCVYYEKRK